MGNCFDSDPEKREQPVGTRWTGGSGWVTDHFAFVASSGDWVKHVLILLCCYLHNPQGINYQYQWTKLIN